MNHDVVPYFDMMGELGQELSACGSLAFVLLDFGALDVIEDEYGSDALDEVRQRILGLLIEQRGKLFRFEDRPALDGPRGSKLLLFLTRKRRKSLAATPSDLKAVRSRLSATLVPNMARAAFPYITGLPRVDVGCGIAIQNPLLHPDRAIVRALAGASEFAAHMRTAEEQQALERLQEILVRERIVTAYQPILRLKDRTLLGFEALSRGPRGTPLEMPGPLFGLATRHGLLIELDRLCRRRALLSSGRISSNAKVFVNTLPATIRDPQFRGKPLIDFLAQAQVSPDRIVLEITEKLVIENYGLFREAMAYFTDLGMSFAVDDVGAGYSGLESIAKLKPAFLKIDTVLVREVHHSLVNREMVKAIVAMGSAIGSTVVAEGIQSEEEVQALVAMGVEYGQGFFLARPDAGPE
jgi:EAL domain-containing protein (putative c-di-GMP-specific phosphodiesterase class I)